MNKIKLLCGVALLSTLSDSPAVAANLGWNGGVRVSTLGIQAEVAYVFNPTFALRLVGGGYEHFQPHLRYGGVHYHHIRYRPIALHLMADWYFLKEYWRLSAGVGYTGTRIRLKRDMKNAPFPQNFLGVITAKYRYKRKIAPYLGTGFDFPHIFGTKCILSIDAGLNFQGKVKSKVTATGIAKNNPAAMSKTHKIVNNLMNDAWWVKSYPVVSIGIKYPF